MSTFKPTWLYIKQHNVTKLKYFGKTTAKDPYKYPGSGVYWKRHLKVHGRDITTLWVQLFNDKVSLIEYATRFSKNNRITESHEWANLTDENGTDGTSQIGSKNGRFNKTVSDETRKKISKANTGKTSGFSWWNNGVTSVFALVAPVGWIKGRLVERLSDDVKSIRKKYLKPRDKLICVHCKKEFDSSSFTRYHGEKCRFRLI